MRSAGLRRTITWRSSIVVTLGATLLVTVSLGPMTSDLGTVSPLVWMATAVVGGLQCFLLARLAARLYDRAGGTATYAHSALGTSLPVLAALSSWSYWFAWTPGIAVNLILAATYFRATIWHGMGTLSFALLLGGLLYSLNAFGLRTSLRVAGIAAAVAVIPLMATFCGALVQPSLLHSSNLTPLAVPASPWHSPHTWSLVVKWLFVAAWSAYGAEMGSTVVAEMRDAKSHAARALYVAGGLGLVSFGGIPLLMLALVGAPSLSKEPLVAFLPVATAVFGGTGRTVIGVMLVAALILGTQAFIVGSSRTIYQMTCDGYMPRQFARTNRRGVPVGSIVWDTAVILVLLLIFGTKVVDVVAAANVGYLLVFVMMPIAFIILERRAERMPCANKASNGLVVLAAILAVFNAGLLLAGGAQWGWKIMLTGLAAVCLIVPVSWLRRVQDRRRGHTRLLPFPAGEPYEYASEMAPGELLSATSGGQ